MKLDLKTEDVQKIQAALTTAFIETVNPDYLFLATHLGNMLMAEQYVKPESELKILLTIHGGVLDSIRATNDKINITVIDLDDMDNGHRNLGENNWAIDKVEPGYIENRICEVNNDYTLLDQERENSSK